ncbi:uncharacterized protein LOC134181698 [Corticium candelabrum]|uniref:uncharacterized protein LOC134181698 n=1 Tax=Corticium candelabrum TaxID=121492 RepID=UPI002E26B0F7|nr:uncharacterized protein LOC134181698 [Corticium candelabrum]
MDEREIQEMVKAGLSHSTISYILRRRHPGVKGFSERSVRRFCHEQNIHYRSALSDFDMRMVGPAYGRKMMKGYLQAGGLRVGDKRIGRILRQVAPGYHGRRQQLAHRTTHVLAIDGYSGFILGLITMPVKNNLIIYNQLFRPILQQFGLWDQIRVDHGREFYLLLYVQEHLSYLRRNQMRAPHVQSMSRENHPAERIWVEVNQRVNYPIKQALNALVEVDQLNMNDPIVRFCLSWITMRVCQVGIERCVLAWNNHFIPRKGIPRDRIQMSMAVRLQAQDIPTVDDAVRSFEGEGGVLNRLSEFGTDRIRCD